MESEIRKKISEFTTKELTDELKNRYGVNSIFVCPNNSAALEVNGPASVIIVTD